MVEAFKAMKLVNVIRPKIQFLNGLNWRAWRSEKKLRKFSWWKTATAYFFGDKVANRWKELSADPLTF